MAIPRFASAARYPTAANTVENIVCALLPQSLSAPGSGGLINIVPSSDSGGESEGGTKSQDLLLGSTDDDSKCSWHDTFSFGDSEEETSSFGDSEQETSSFGDSEEEMQPVLRPEPVPVLLSGLKRRSGMQIPQQELLQGLQAMPYAIESVGVSTSSKAYPNEESLADIRLLKPNDFLKFLQEHNVPVMDYDRGKARCLQDLWAEVVIGECSLERVSDPMGSSMFCLQRRVRGLILEVTATIEGQEKFLLLKREENDHGHVRDNLDSRVTTKIFDDEDVPSALRRALRQNLEMESRSVEEEFAIESTADVESVLDAIAYPGLRTVYSMHVVYMRVRDTNRPKMAAIGLPSGSSFTAEMMVSALSVGKRRTWCWCIPNTMEAAK
mmetsp:Transcript_7838/g.22171  ORF Transcript_7838/g.22171 Transcript_7838/m.22171 type:complete len:383 (-) Transcript_7838:80-1228(-)